VGLRPGRRCPGLTWIGGLGEPGAGGAVVGLVAADRQERDPKASAELEAERFFLVQEEGAPAAVHHAAVRARLGDVHDGARLALDGRAALALRLRGAERPRGHRPGLSVRVRDRTDEEVVTDREAAVAVEGSVVEPDRADGVAGGDPTEDVHWAGSDDACFEERQELAGRWLEVRVRPGGRAAARVVERPPSKAEGAGRMGHNGKGLVKHPRGAAHRGGRCFWPNPKKCPPDFRWEPPRPSM
jgi:hypothetical protein